MKMKRNPCNGCVSFLLRRNICLTNGTRNRQSFASISNRQMLSYRISFGLRYNLCCRLSQPFLTQKIPIQRCNNCLLCLVNFTCYSIVYAITVYRFWHTPLLRSIIFSATVLPKLWLPKYPYRPFLPMALIYSFQHFHLLTTAGLAWSHVSLIHIGRLLSPTSTAGSRTDRLLPGQTNHL